MMRVELFESDVTRQPERALAALAICRFCDVVDACRREALFAVQLSKRGIVGGVTKASVHNARLWRSYEHGLTDTRPNALRPSWLPNTDAARNVAKFRSGSYITFIESPAGDSL